ncbi:phosphoglycerate mutase family protein [Oesophagostomum dentatum]|uniref:Phosphoglycerate mutase family protein n=1 Tax=Oesophagostomum dentatum TaxID=61180 RepID=A0A0B1T5B0_OESDE|nr:phosphoglycerate mutase family protein [Oesophagostomum dentatum]
MVKHHSRILWFVRHGERVDNQNKAWKLTAERWDDPPLSPRGHQQAREVGLALANEPIDYIICSPFTRCVETANGILSVRKSPPPVWIEPGLGESLNACMTPPGRPTMEQIKKMCPYVDDSYVPVYKELPPEIGGDAGCIPRTIKTLRTTIETYPTGNILFISHGSPTAACHLAICGTWKYVGQCTIGKVITEAGIMKCEYFGDKRHLSDQTDLHEAQSKARVCTSEQIDDAMKSVNGL